MSQAKIVLGLAGLFLASSSLFVLYDSLSEKKRMRQGIFREIEKAMANKVNVDDQKESFKQWKEEKKAENRRKRESVLVNEFGWNYPPTGTCTDWLPSREGTERIICDK